MVLGNEKNGKEFMIMMSTMILVIQMKMSNLLVQSMEGLALILTLEGLEVFENQLKRVKKN